MRIGNKLNIAIWLKTLAFVLTVSPLATQATTNGFIVPSFRGASNSQFGYWESFTVAVGAPGNLPDQPGATTTAVLTQSHPAAQVIGSGNLYNPGGASSFALTNSTPFALGTVILQIRTAGTELDYNSVLLTYSDTNGITQTNAPLFRYELNRSAGSVSSIWQWDLMGLAISNYNISFNPPGPHLSLDSMTLDTSAPIGTNFIDSVAFLQQPFALRSRPATLARWNYPFNGNPGGRTTAGAFSALGSNPDFDTRDAQYLLGWNTTHRIPAGQGAANYVIRRARVTLSIATGDQYTYSGTLRDFRSYLPATDPRYVAPTTTGNPVELFGAGFRGGFINNESAFVPWASTNYPQNGSWGADPNFNPFAPDATYYTNRAVYAAGFDTNGVLVDVSNSVADDGTTETVNPFEVAPFAVGQSTNVAVGEKMPLGSQLTFDLNLDDPLIYGYVQKSLNDGNLSFMVSTLESGASPLSFPNFYTIFHPTAQAIPSRLPQLDIEGQVIRASQDGDADGLSDDWENFYFGSLVRNATNDVDSDGVNNLAEYLAGTIPTVSQNFFRLLSSQRQPNTSEVYFAPAPGRQYSIQSSDDLLSWQTTTNPALFYSSAWLAKTGTNLVYPSPVFAGWRESNATNQQRFYRIGTK